MRKKKCYGCDFEMNECYRWQNKEGFSAGLDWGEIDGEEHCFLFVIRNKTGSVTIS